MSLIFIFTMYFFKFSHQKHKQKYVNWDFIKFKKGSSQLGQGMVSTEVGGSL